MIRNDEPDSTNGTGASDNEDPYPFAIIDAQNSDLQENQSLSLGSQVSLDSQHGFKNNTYLNEVLSKNDRQTTCLKCGKLMKQSR